MSPNRKKIHFYGRYSTADFKCVFQILKDRYDTTYDFYMDTAAIPDFSRPSSADFILSENNGPEYCCGKNIDVGHGYGLISGFGDVKNRKLLHSLMQNFFSICIYGTYQKNILLHLGYPEERIIVFGMPYSIDLLKKIDEAKRERFLLSKGLNPRNKTLLYAPTWDQKIPKNRIERFFNRSSPTRQFFELWWQDGKEYERVGKLCEFCNKNNINFIVRMHERARYAKDWLALYSDIFDRHRVSRHYIDEDMDNLPYLLYSDVLLGDVSSMNTYFYVMDKPVIHLNKNLPFSEKLTRCTGAMRLDDRAGHVVDNFDEMLEKIKDSLENPGRFKSERSAIVRKYIDYLGDECIDVIKDEFKRVFSLK